MEITVQLKRFVLISTTWVISISSGFGQQNGSLNKDSVKTISMAEFDYLVNSSILLLETKELADISDDQHIAIMMCLNTIFMARNSDLSRRFVGGPYEKLKTVADEKKYDSEIIKVYPNWIPNRGMGFYFPDLKMELYGTPGLYAWYQVDN